MLAVVPLLLLLASLSCKATEERAPPPTPEPEALDQAMTRTLAQGSARFVYWVDMTPTWYTLEGVIDFVTGSGSVVAKGNGIGNPVFAEFRYVGGLAYERSMLMDGSWEPWTIREPKGDAVPVLFSDFLFLWTLSPADSGVRTFGEWFSSTVGDIGIYEFKGTDRVRGVDTIKFTGPKPSQYEPATSILLDGDGSIRRIEHRYSYGAGRTVVGIPAYLEFFDFGTPVNVAAPQVARDSDD
jgi:hypothetical protein